jgi:NAD(P)-dependent dehydrogenase (short-subunit alcohol dehydrogenase family)
MAETSIVLITGGNTGIGYETVKALYASAQAHTILMGSRSLEKAKEAISTLQGEVTETKSEVVSIQIDIEDDSSIENAFKEVESKYGRIDALVNNAGKSRTKLYRKLALMYLRRLFRRQNARRF